MHSSETLYRVVSEHDARATVDTAWELGIRYFDLAPHYGLGLSERRLGGALQARARGDFVISTKVGRLLEPLPKVEGLHHDGYAVPPRTDESSVSAVTVSAVA